jgi:molybdopterin/thiamine biosynthesis adenylyltransferase/rhodanese-related sulfurtransferase
MNRYIRQTVLKDLGPSGQNALCEAKVLILGCGGLGSPLALYLAAAGVGRIGLVDGDLVELSNLQRQILYAEKDVGREKSLAATERIRSANASVRVDTYSRRFEGAWALDVAPDYDVLVDGTDNFSAKFLINDVSLKLQKPLVHGSVSEFEGRFGTFSGKKGPCYRCLYPKSPKSSVQNCQEAGVLGAVVGVVGVWQALECLKVILDLAGIGRLNPQYGRISIVDFFDNSFRSLEVPQRENCLCHLDPSQIEIKEEAQLLCVSSKTSPASLSWAEAQELEGAQFLDVRELSEISEAMIPEARHWPLSKIENNEFPGFIKDGDRWVVYCASGFRSQRAVVFLEQHNQTFSKARFYNLAGGILSLPSF